MTDFTAAFLAKLPATKFVWCQHGQMPGMKMDEHQVCIDQEAAHRAKGGTTWGCTCNCHR